MWVEVLVDCPGAQGIFTYRLPPRLVVQPGDILSVPFGMQQVGAIAIRCLEHLPAGLEPSQIRDIDDLVQSGFFSETYWQLLNRVASYYCTSLMQIVRVALPPGLLARSQRRVRLLDRTEHDKEAKKLDDLRLLTPDSPLPIPHSSAAHQILTLLRASKTGAYSWQFLQRQVQGARQGLQALLQQGLVEQYLEPPTPVRPKQKLAVTFVASPTASDLTPRQQEILSVLRRQGGELWLTELLQLCQTSSTTLKSLAQKGQVVIQPREVLRREGGSAISADDAKTLTPDQTAALETIQALSGFAQVLLHGVTGSGKTEVYLQAIAPILQQGRSALVLVPEIGLTPQLTDRFRARFGSRVCVYHSALSDGERYDTWRQMLNGDAQVVIGTRSAVFAPLPRLGLIVLDEEHDGSFKQDQPAPCYHSRTVASWRAELECCPLLLGSATPSLESWVACMGGEVEGRKQEAEGGSRESGVASRESAVNSQNSKLSSVRVACSTDSAAQSATQNAEGSGESTARTQNSKLKIQNSKLTSSLTLTLPTRVYDRPLPPIEVVDMRQELHHGNHSIFSQSLRLALLDLKERQQQGILFIHRRGHSTFVSCRSCGYVVTCPNCDVSLAYHHVHSEATPLLRCHYCNHTCLLPNDCPTCRSTYFKYFGSGTQRIAQAIAQEFPDLRLIRFDSDTTRTKGAHRALLTQFADGDADLLVGTQMLTKGIDLPQVTLVGIVSADGLLHMADYRANERAFQTLTQVAGRCGRGEAPGRVILQTYSPEHPVIQAVQHHAYERFVTDELQHRSQLHYPPYSRLILLRFSSTSPIAVQQAAERVALALAHLEEPGVERLGPAPATILRVARRYHWQLLFKLPLTGSVSLPDFTTLRSWCTSNVSLTIDVDPLTML
ncbi:MAG: primosomal protein N' [Stenomitos rutilans HA7619-LM2]|jgi:primosomal protein N' (replication factor Y)|nr:primosomal protein N' [Stenomitos rutilans HA7619-LM2]